jgi:single-strand DNA-binding protein
MNLRNRVQLIGNLGSNPIVKVFESGNKMARFSIATSDTYKKDGKFINDTQWHTIVTWGKTAEIAEKNLQIGCEVVVDGRLNTRKYVDKNGNNQIITEVIAHTIIYRKKANNTNNSEVLNKNMSN